MLLTRGAREAADNLLPARGHSGGDQAEGQHPEGDEADPRPSEPGRPDDGPPGSRALAAGGHGEGSRRGGEAVEKTQRPLRVGAPGQGFFRQPTSDVVVSLSAGRFRLAQPLVGTPAGLGQMTLGGIATAPCFVVLGCVPEDAAEGKRRVLEAPLRQEGPGRSELLVPGGRVGWSSRDHRPPEDGLIMGRAPPVFKGKAWVL